MFLQGDLQSLFDALYAVGAIDPVLRLNWDEISAEMNTKPDKWSDICAQLNHCNGDRGMLERKLKEFDERSLHYVAMEVAREFVEFQDRDHLH